MTPPNRSTCLILTFISIETRVGGFHFPTQLGEKGVFEKYTLDSDGISVRARKDHLRAMLNHKSTQLKRKAESDPEAAQEYARRYPEVEPPVEGIYCGLDLRNIAEQPFVYSKRSASGYRGVQKTDAGHYTISIGSGENGKNKCLGTFPTAEEAAQIYAKAKYYLKEYGPPEEWKSGKANDHNSSDEEAEQEMEEEGHGHQQHNDYQWLPEC